jgi:hypothetical protein
MSMSRWLVVMGIGTLITGCVIASPPVSGSPTVQTARPGSPPELRIISLEPLGLRPAQEIPDGPQLPVHATDSFGLTRAN